MAQKFAVINVETSVIENIIMAEDGFALEGKLLILAVEGAAIGGIYAGGVFSPPPAPEPAPLPIPETISRRQFYQGLAVAEKITQAEALAAIKTATLPAALQAMVDGMTDPDAAFEADMLLSGASDFQRSHPLVKVFAIAQGMSEADVDDFWRLCAPL